jgi:hypothetical protein
MGVFLLRENRAFPGSASLQTPHPAWGPGSGVRLRRPPNPLHGRSGDLLPGPPSRYAPERTRGHTFRTAGYLITGQRIPYTKDRVKRPAGRYTEDQVKRPAADTLKTKSNALTGDTRKTKSNALTDDTLKTKSNTLTGDTLKIFKKCGIPAGKP